MNAATSLEPEAGTKTLPVGKRDMQVIEGLVKEYCSHFGVRPQNNPCGQIQEDTATLKATLRKTILPLNFLLVLFFLGLFTA